MKWGWAILWLAFVAYAAFAAPPDDPALTRALVRGCVTGDFGGVDPAVAAVFSMLGVVPVLASAFVLRDGARRRLPSWPFAVGMFAVGAFALLPWLALRDLGASRSVPRAAGPVRRLLARPIVGIGIVAALIGLSAWAAFRGHASAYLVAVRTTSMVNVMSVDLVVCTLLLHVLVEQARTAEVRRHESATARIIRFVPLVGVAAWNALVRRAP